MLDFLPTDKIASRTLSAFPVSVGTSLALEALFDGIEPSANTKDPIEKVDISKYSTIYINIWTLFRNLFSALTDNTTIMTEDHRKFKDAILEEIDFINGLFQNEGGGVIAPLYYFCSYEKLYTQGRHNSIQFRTERTAKALKEKSVFMKALKELMKETEEIQQLDSSIKPNGLKAKSLILTHVPYDLVSEKNFSTLDLLESHTGKLKKKFKFNTKYYPVGERDLSKLPFNRKLLLVFGDKVLIKPNDYDLRAQIVHIAEKRNWTPFTTEEKMLFDFSLEIKEPYVLQFLNSL